ncbi:MAG: bifunctional nuclease family protein [Dehalococcoidia bacterium]|nr:bifunctional nuclease family protein [Dehalococcoidia bacterium]
MNEVIIDSIRVGLRHYRRVVVLKEKDAERFLPIWIGADVADSIAFRLQDVSSPRPLTHDLLMSMIDSLGGVIKSVVINDLREDTFYALINIEKDNEIIEVDARSSDAIAIAVRASVPIYVADHVLETAAVVLDSEVSLSENISEVDQTPVSNEELEKLEIFRDFVDELDLDNLGREPQSEV